MICKKYKYAFLSDQHEWYILKVTTLSPPDKRGEHKKHRIHITARCTMSQTEGPFTHNKQREYDDWFVDEDWRAKFYQSLEQLYEHHLGALL